MHDNIKNKVQAQANGIEIGLYTLGDLCPDPFDGQTISARQRINEIMEAAKLADEAGLDIFGIGEHHRLDYATSSPQVVLAAIAQKTKRINLTSATTVISTVDPVRLYEDFATLDLLSEGRAEIIAGRGAFVESFPLFGYELEDYDALFSEHLELLLKLNEQETVSWQGKFRSPLNDAEIAPRALQEKLPIWVGVGGSPQSAIRAGKLGVGMTVAILGGELLQFKPLIDLYRKTATETGVSSDAIKVAVTGHGYFAESSQLARDEFYPYYANYWANVNRQRGMSSRSLTRSEFDAMTGDDRALFVGSPEQIIEKILYQYESFGHQRFMAQIDIGGLPFKQIAKSIELLATKIAPVIRKQTSSLQNV